ncbi:MAG: class I tRNA ligase family protein [Parcubacteria group bacterium]|nr:class I tRNA ligase family protein [Parcubacteria group bacterium]
MPDFSLTKIEEKIQKFWEANAVSEKILSRNKGKKKFVFYEGPPTANGLPHIGHFLTRAFKDLFVRYKTMRGFFVPRRAGWDTHGLPVEIEVEKKLGLKNKKEIEEYGIAEFNKKAKQSAQEYKTEWEKFSKRIGFWLDFDNPYVTYANDYIETLWHIVKQFEKKKYLYKGHKVLPWCPRCGTALSSHEVAQGYETITENSVIVKFLISNSEFLNKSKIPNPKLKTYILSWTTTPWTLPGNVALAVGESIKYQVLRIKGKDENYILAEGLAEKILNTEYEILNTILGKDLVGLEYEPLFDIPRLRQGSGGQAAYKIYPADFVNTEEGTGVVHTAVMYGEDDYQLGEKVGLPKRHTVDKEGKFTEDVSEFAGQFVKDAEKGIIKYLDEKGFLFDVKPYTHDYPFCWRCKTPLLYYAADSLFVKTTAVKKQLIGNNKKINWIPSYIKEGRFGQWLKEVKDWAFSRARYWGTPLPVWQCRECKENLVVGSLEELEKHRYRKPNKYFILRHTEKGNPEGVPSGPYGAGKNLAAPNIISSKLEHDKYGLTDKGAEDAKKLGEKLKGKIDLVISSPFLRTKTTAKIIAGVIGLEVKIDERLKELDHGSVCEGKEHMVCLPKESYPPQDFNQKFGSDGESWNDVRKRMFAALKELEEKYEGKNILIISHGDPLWLLEGLSKNLTDKESLNLKMQSGEYLKTGGLKQIEFKNLPRDESGNLDLHRPYIDEVFLKCPRCKGEMRRVPEVIDVWFDSGAMPFAQAHWPFEKEKPEFPAEFITEGVDQTRGWFYTLLAVSTLLGFGPPYKNVISLGHVLDKDGKKMSKSIGNVVSPAHVIEKFGADAARWWFYKVNQAGDSKSFKEEELKEVNNGFVRVLMNSLRFWQLYHKTRNIEHETKINFHKIKPQELTLLDRWLLSKWNNLIGSVTRSLDEYDAAKASREIEKFVIEDLSNWWLRRSRANFQFSNSNFQLKSDLLRFVLLELAKLIAPFTPFLAEHLHEELHHGTKPGTASIHFHDWPGVNKKLIDEKLEEEMETVRQAVRLGLAARKEKNIKVRQPLSVLSIKYKVLSINEELVNLIKEEVNVKEAVFENGEGDISVFLDTDITLALRAEGWVREFVRMVQDARKDAGYDFDEKVSAYWFSEDATLSEALKREGKFIIQKTVLKELRQGRHDPNFVYDVEKEQELEPNRKVWLGLKK